MGIVHPEGLPKWAMMFVTVACGAISGFHATQSPMMARCMTSEKEGRTVFYGAMVSEGVIALIWAAAGVTFYNGVGALDAAINAMGQGGVVYQISTTLMGSVGGVLAMICLLYTSRRGLYLQHSEGVQLSQRFYHARLCRAGGRHHGAVPYDQALLHLALHHGHRGHRARTRL